MARSPLEPARRLLPFAFTFAVGLVVLGYATASYASYVYVRANPAAGTVSTSAGYELFTLLLFVVGAVVTFLAAGAALYRVREDTR